MSELAKVTEMFLQSSRPEPETARMRRLSRADERATLPCASLPSSAIHPREQLSSSESAEDRTRRLDLRVQLERLSILEGVSPALFDTLTRQAPVRRLHAGQPLLVAGETNDCMFVVLSGELAVRLGTADVAVLHAGDTVGELSVLDRRAVSADVVAKNDSSLLAIGEAMFWRICHASHPFSVQLMQKLAERLRANNCAVRANMEQCAKLEAAAARDPLTKVQSRHWLDEMLPRLCELHRQNGEALSIAIVDVDHFKRVNDTYGHPVGDVVLTDVAATLRGKLRPTDFVARFGGEEFVVILPHTSVVGAHIASERLADAVRGTSMHTRDGVALPGVTISVGVAELTDGDDCTRLLERADAAMYRAKNNGRDRVES